MIVGPTSTSIWNCRLRKLAKDSQFRSSLTLYRLMLHHGDSPNASTFPLVLKTCATLNLPFLGTQIHAHVIKVGTHSDPSVHTSLISMYCKCSMTGNARKLFNGDECSKKFTVCCNAMISGYTINSKIINAISLFLQMVEDGVRVNHVTLLCLIPGCRNQVHLGLGLCLHGYITKCGYQDYSSVGNCLLTMYMKCGAVNHAQKLFSEMPEKNLITWNAMISGYAQNGYANLVLDMYHKMERHGICPNPIAFVAVLSSCANLGARTVGRMVESKIKSCGLEGNPYLDNALINMHARCGNLDKARRIFDKMPHKSVVSWTAIIGGYGVHGHGETAAHLFDEMIQSGVWPDGTALVSVLSACAHAGLTKKGLVYFHDMRKYGLQPGVEHYGCAVDLLGRAGRLDEAMCLIKRMPVRPDSAVWGAILGACKIHKRVELAELAFKKLVKLEPTNVGYYVLLSNMYMGSDDLEGVLKIRTLMKERGLKKEPGFSLVEFSGKVHTFFVGDNSHPQSSKIHRLLDELDKAMEVPNLRGDKEGKLGKDESWMHVHVRTHSEKLAIAFGILNIEGKRPIIVIKNLRICDDCHLFLSATSKIVNRKFIVRDATRFHHFSNGSCSCNGFW